MFMAAQQAPHTHRRLLDWRTASYLVKHFLWQPNKLQCGGARSELYNECCRTSETAAAVFKRCDQRQHATTPSCDNCPQHLLRNSGFSSSRCNMHCLQSHPGPVSITIPASGWNLNFVQTGDVGCFHSILQRMLRKVYRGSMFRHTWQCDVRRRHFRNDNGSKSGNVYPNVYVCAVTGFMVSAVQQVRLFIDI
jgi:hypothetical protein